VPFATPVIVYEGEWARVSILCTRHGHGWGIELEDIGGGIRVPCAAPVTVHEQGWERVRSYGRGTATHE